MRKIEKLKATANEKWMKGFDYREGQGKSMGEGSWYLAWAGPWLPEEEVNILLSSLSVRVPPKREQGVENQETDP